MSYWLTKERYYRKFFLKYELQKLVLKAALANKRINWSLKFYFHFCFLKFKKHSSVSFYRNRCLVTDWCRAVFRKFRMSRHQSKLMASFGFICGLRKSSF